MALKNTLTPETAIPLLATALEDHLDGARDIEVRDVETPEASGLSNETVLFSATWRHDGKLRVERLVARIAPIGPAIFPRYDFSLESRVIQALQAHTDVPVPELVVSIESPEPLGAPCMIMRRVDGKIPPDDPPYTAQGWVLQLEPDHRGRLVEGALDVLATLHAADPDAIGLGDLRRHPEAGLEGQLQFYRAFYKWAAGGDMNPTVEAGFRWLQDHRPDDLGDEVITWGDARIGNIIYRDDLSVAAVLDWEMVAYGPAAMDLGWMLFINRFHTQGIGAAVPAGFPSPEETVTRYQQLTGRTITDLLFWEVLAAVKLSVMLHRAGTLMVEHGLLPPDATMKLNNPATQLLATLAGLPAPTGQTQSFIGNR